jgi:3-methyladenine DNA glycosylase AlkD
MIAKEISKRLREMANEKDARFLQGFFKTGAGQYGEGDIFLGIRVPVLRKLAKESKSLMPEDVLPLLRSPYHEERAFALIMLVNAFAKGDDGIQKQIYDLYLANTQHINNWDLVDISAPNIVGAFLLTRDRKVIYQLAKSKSFWERRISMLATLYFIRRNQFADTLKIAEILLHDKQDLIHKAVGWMLREVGKRDTPFAEVFLKAYCKKMPRTMLRYAVERLPQTRRKMYMDGTV